MKFNVYYLLENRHVRRHPTSLLFTSVLSTIYVSISLSLLDEEQESEYLSALSISTHLDG